MLSNEHQSRMEMLFTFGDYHRNPAANKSLLIKFYHFLLNFFAHFKFDYLFIKGDPNLRHSPLFAGQLSYFSLAVIGMFVSGLLFRVIQLENRKIWVLCLWGICCHTLAAALTWDDIPHALRSIGAWPFFVILIAYMFDRVSVKIPIAVCYAGILLQCALFHWHYQQAVPAFRPWFDTHITDLANNNPKALDTEKYFEVGKFYHRYRTGNLSEIELRQACRVSN